jgi:hypothetical protein
MHRKVVREQTRPDSGTSLASDRGVPNWLRFGVPAILPGDESPIAYTSMSNHPRDIVLPTFLMRGSVGFNLTNQAFCR